MTLEDKELLLKDLCARLPYGMIILHEGWNYEWDDSLSTRERVVGMDDKFVYTKVIDTKTGEEYREDKWPISTFDAKPYLCPMSSMMEEEKKYIRDRWCYQWDGESFFEFFNCKSFFCLDDTFDLVDWLNAHHFDYRGLIEKGLALEAPDGMYDLT